MEQKSYITLPERGYWRRLLSCKGYHAAPGPLLECARVRPSLGLSECEDGCSWETTMYWGLDVQ